LSIGIGEEGRDTPFHVRPEFGRGVESVSQRLAIRKSLSDFPDPIGETPCQGREGGGGLRELAAQGPDHGQIEVREVEAGIVLGEAPGEHSLDDV
jgi:hypothetical protein